VAVAWKPLAVLWFGGFYGWVVWTLMLSLVLGMRWRQARRNPAV
jgi:hypothetical protein